MADENQGQGNRGNQGNENNARGSPERSLAERELYKRAALASAHLTGDVQGGMMLAEERIRDVSKIGLWHTFREQVNTYTSEVEKYNAELEKWKQDNKSKAEKDRSPLPDKSKELVQSEAFYGTMLGSCQIDYDDFRTLVDTAKPLEFGKTVFGGRGVPRKASQYIKDIFAQNKKVGGLGDLEKQIIKETETFFLGTVVPRDIGEMRLLETYRKLEPKQNSP